MIIGIGCQKRVGKDTVADYLVKNYNFTKGSFAGPLKELCFLISERYNEKYSDEELLRFLAKWRSIFAPEKDFDVVFSELLTIAYTGYNHNEVYMFTMQDDKYRFLLQYVGTDLFRKVMDNFWIRSLERQLAQIPKQISVVITDVRFPNEKEFVDSIGTAVRIVRPDLETEEVHESETALLDADWKYIITNDGSLAKLYEQAEDLVMFLAEMEIRKQL